MERETCLIRLSLSASCIARTATCCHGARWRTLLAKTGGTGGHRPLEGGSGARETLDRARADGEWVDGPSPSPSPSVTAGGTGSGGGVEVFAGREARERAANAVEWRQRSNYSAGSSGSGTAEERGRAERPLTDPSLSVTHTGFQWRAMRSGQSVAGEGRAERSVDDPSLTITGRTDLCSWEGRGEPPACGCRWDMIDAGGFCACCHAHIDDPRGLYVVQGDGSHSMPSCPAFEAPTHYDRGQGETQPDWSRVQRRLIPVDEPAPAVSPNATGRDAWVTERPSTSVNCDPRIAEPGRHDPEESGSQYGAATVRVSVEEAAALQSFPPGYPWEAAGTKTAAFRACGNAVPPRLALHVLAMGTGREVP
jgi:hypothetical protein